MNRVITLAVAGIIVGSLLATGARAASVATNSMTVLDKSGVAQTNYPLQFARPFVQGEIADYPQVLVNGAAVSTQADIKQRWPDGSVKHAILSLLVPSIPASGSVNLTFQNQTDGNNTPLTQSDMLDAAYDFDAVIQIAAGDVTCSASARTMLSDGNFTYWTQGPIATTIILADHSTARAYDMGFDNLKSIRPVFEATFWPGINKVRVRFIAEDCNSEALEDAMYDITLTTGSAAPATVYTKTGFVHKAATRWTKVFWVGGAPESKINIDNNVAYLVQTRFFPMYDTSLTIPEKTINDDYTKWKTTAHDLQDSGWWCKGMGVTGGRDDIGHMPRWMTQWLYTGDYRSREIALGHADLAVNWPVQVREGNPTKLYDRAQTIPALGRPVSVCARGPLWIFDSRGGTNSSYWIPIQGTNIDIPNGKGGWGAQLAHQPDPFSLAYTVTGEHWYLEQVQMWAAWDILYVWPARRGPAGYAGIVDEVRGDGWSFRNRVHAAFLSPDGTPEKDYFITTTNDVIAHWEGWHGVNGNFTQHKLWPWAKSKIDEPNDGLSEISPLHFMDVGDPAPWQLGFVMIELGAARDMGFATEPMAAWLGQFFTQQFLDPGYCVYRVDTYYFPGAHNADGTWCTTWAQMEQRCLADVADQGTDADARSRFYAHASDTTHGYSVIASAATAVNACYPQADVGWNFMKANVRDNHVSDFSANPKFAINPRGKRLDVGSGMSYATVQAAIDAADDGDIIQIWSGTYTQEAGWAHINRNNLRIVGMGATRPVIDAGGSCLDGKGIFVISGYDTIIQNIEFANAKDTAVGSAAGIRLQARGLTVSNCSIHDSDNGILIDGLNASSVSIDSSEFNYNGHGDGLSHNICVGAINSLLLKNCWVHNANGGCEVRSQAATNSVFYNRIGNEGGNGTHEIDATGCGATWIIGNQIEQSATGTDDTIIACGSGGAIGGSGGNVYVAYNTFVNSKTNGTFVNNTGTTSALLQNNIFQGAGTVLVGLGTQTANWVTSSAGLRDPANYDFRLTPASTGAIGKGTTPGAVGSMTLVPSYHYVHPCTAKQREANTATDIGAYNNTPAIVVNPGTTQSVFRPDPANLSGSATGGDGPMSYLWSQVSGPGDVAFDDSTSPATTARFTNSGTYVLQLQATDGMLTAANTVTIKVDPPSDVTNLAAGNATPKRLILTWTAPGDIAGTGAAASYDIRYSTATITESNFASATKLANPPTPAQAGLSENATVSGLSVNTIYYFAIKTTNYAGVTSNISNIATGQTTQINMTVVAMKRDPGLADNRGLASTFSTAVSNGLIPVTGPGMVADVGCLNTDLVYLPQNIYYNYGGSTVASSGRPILVKFALTAIPSFAGCTVNRAELRFYTNSGNTGMSHTGYITSSDWIEGSRTGSSPGSAGGASGAHPMGHNAAAYQTTDGVPVALNAPGFASWANGQPFAPSKDGVTVVTGLAHNPWGIVPGDSDTQFLTVDVTPILKLWAAGTPNYGFFVDNTGNYYPCLSENTSTERQPTLFVEYYQYTPDPTTPTVPYMGSATATTVRILNLGSENDAATAYAVQEAITGRYVGPTGQLQAEPFWQVRQAWSNVTIWGLASQTTYMFKSKALNTVAVESAYSSLTIVTTSVAGDIDGDSHVNVGDLQALVAAWGSQYGPPLSTNWNAAADINGDGRVDVADLQALVTHWNQ